MERMQQTSSPLQPDVGERLTFDQFVGQLPSSKQTIHRVMVWLFAAAFLLMLGALIYAIYASFTVQTVGESNVVLAWLLFFLAGAVFAFLFGLDTLNLGATIPLPTGGSKYSYGTGRSAARTGWGGIAYGVVVTILVIVGVAAVQTGVFGLEDLVTIIVGFYAILGVGSAALAVLLRILQTGRS